jgi:hypothetical protein
MQVKGLECATFGAYQPPLGWLAGHPFLRGSYRFAAKPVTTLCFLIFIFLKIKIKIYVWVK